MNINKLTFGSAGFPESLKDIPGPPKTLYHAGANLVELSKWPCLAIVGSRDISIYGRQVTTELASRLAEQGLVIISGLALGVDALAHQATLAAGGLTIAVLPTPLDAIGPASNRQLAHQILEQGGALISEYEPGSVPFKQNFVARNRLMAGLAQAVLITEAAAKSGSLHTAQFALEQGKDVLAVPGDINRLGSVGTNSLIRSGATPVTSYCDVLQAMGLEPRPVAITRPKGSTRHEQSVIDLLSQGVYEGEALLKRSRLSISEFRRALTMLEISGIVYPLGGDRWALR